MYIVDVFPFVRVLWRTCFAVIFVFVVVQLNLISELPRAYEEDENSLYTQHAITLHLYTYHT